MNYLLGLLAAIIGILVVMLRMKGGALHEAQLKLLSLRLKNTNEEDFSAITQARLAFSDAYNEYLKAKGEE